MNSNVVKSFRTCTGEVEGVPYSVNPVSVSTGAVFTSKSESGNRPEKSDQHSERQKYLINWFLKTKKNHIFLHRF
jgi:hypothetical protein